MKYYHENFSIEVTINLLIFLKEHPEMREGVTEEEIVRDIDKWTKLKLLGHEVYAVGCDNFDKVKGCLGHENEIASGTYTTKPE